MLVKIAHRKRWLRYATVVAAVLWAIGVAGGCHHPHTSMGGVRSSPISAAVGGRDVVAVVHPVSVSDGAALPVDRGCKHVVQTCATTDLVALADVFALVFLLGSAAWPVVSVPRGPPGPVDLAFHRSGRNILTRFCIARI
jgi:hypothetical protein